jgi:hypothetical protein
MFGPLVDAADQLEDELLGPVVHLPRHPLALARFGLPALLPATLTWLWWAGHRRLLGKWIFWLAVVCGGCARQPALRFSPR